MYAERTAAGKGADRSLVAALVKWIVFGDKVLSRSRVARTARCQRFVAGVHTTPVSVPKSCRKAQDADRLILIKRYSDRRSSGAGASGDGWMTRLTNKVCLSIKIKAIKR